MMKALEDAVVPAAITLIVMGTLLAGGGGASVAGVLLITGIGWLIWHGAGK